MDEVADRAGGEEGQTPDVLWDDWDTPPRLPSSPELHLEGFEGPLDLLLDLAERQRIDLGQISILQLVEQFVAAMARFVDHVPLRRRADWLVVASRLVLLRSRLCFPASPEARAGAERDARHAVARLEDIRFTRAETAWLDARLQIGREVFRRGSGPSPRVSSYMDLMEACLTILLREEEQFAESPQLEELLRFDLRPFRVSDVLSTIRVLLRMQNQVLPLESFLPTPETLENERSDVAMAISNTFSALLELTRLGETTISQHEAFATIYIARST